MEAERHNAIGNTACLHLYVGLLGLSSLTNASPEDRGIRCFASKLQLESLLKAGAVRCHHLPSEVVSWLAVTLIISI